MKKSNIIIIIVLLICCLAIPGVLFLTKKKTEDKVGNEKQTTTALETTSNTPAVAESETADDEKETSGEEVKETTGETPSEVETEPETTKSETVQFVESDSSYFDDALFIGDSRTVGISEYGSIKNADFFTSTGMSVYNIEKEKLSVGSVGKVTLDELLAAKQYKKVYVMLGINELGYDIGQNAVKFRALVEKIRSLQPQAIVYVEANLHVTADRSDTDPIFNNANINAYNEKIKEIADGRDIFYIDVNEIFDDEKGNLDKQFSYDNTHPLGKYYKVWSDWIMSHTVVK